MSPESSEENTIKQWEAYIGVLSAVRGLLLARSVTSQFALLEKSEQCDGANNFLRFAMVMYWSCVEARF
jgi:hypothetical protein